MAKKIKILTQHEVEKKIERLAWEVYERNSREKSIIIMGIANRGMTLAKALSEHIRNISNINVITGKITLDKDNPYNKDIDTNISISECKDKVVLICDDVLNSGKTLIYASRYFLQVPIDRLSTVVLVDRNHNKYPIRADYVGLSLATTLKEYINVVLDGSIGDQGVYIS